MPEMKEGAFSHGPMVPVFRSEDPVVAQRALEALDAAGVPAIRADQVVGSLVGPVPPGVVVLIVPLGLLPQARQVIEQEKLHPVVSTKPARLPPGEPSSLSAPTGASLGTTTSAPSVRPTQIVPLRPPPPRPPLAEAEQDGPLETAPFIAMSGQSRITIALAACSIGAVLQAALVAQGGFEFVRRHLALSWDGHTFHGNAVTAGFVHGSAPHFLSNLVIGLLLGFVLLGTHGFGATAFVWLVASMLGIAAEAYLSPHAVVLGASAGIYGLVGLWLRGELRRASRAVLPRRARIKALGVIVLLAPGALTPFTSSGNRVAVLAHLVGFSVGLLAGSVFPRWLDEDDRSHSDGRNRWALGIAGAITISGMVMAFVAAA